MTLHHEGSTHSNDVIIVIFITYIWQKIKANESHDSSFFLFADIFSIVLGMSNLIDTFIFILFFFFPSRLYKVHKYMKQ